MYRTTRAPEVALTLEDPERLAAELATRIVAARVGAAAGRPNLGEGRDAAGYFRVILDETRRSLGLPPIAAEPDGPDG